MQVCYPSIHTSKKILLAFAPNLVLRARNPGQTDRLIDINFFLNLLGVDKIIAKFY